MTNGRTRGHQLLKLRIAIAGLAVGAPGAASRATDIIGVQPAALDQPRINAIIRSPSATSDPLYVEFDKNNRSFNINAFFDTGASGILISPNTAAYLNLPTQPGVTFYDVGVGGEDAFGVSAPVHVSLAHSTTSVDDYITSQEEAFSSHPTPTFNGIDLSPYQHTTGPIRTQVGISRPADPTNPNANTLLDDLDVIGMPVMKGKVVVMDPRPVDTIFTGQADIGFLMKTYVYNPGTPARPATSDSDPGIARTTRTIKLSYGSFDQYTRLDPPGSTGPTLEHNPFIGPNPVNPAGDPTPPVKISYNGRTTTGSFLLDTGAAASMISQAKANALGITLDESDPNNPKLIGVPEDEQFTLSIGGVGGTKKVAGFYLSSLLLRTTEGNVNNDLDPKHFRFLDAPVLVADLTVRNPTTDKTLTLDGIFGMNFLVASAFVSTVDFGGTQFPFPSLLAPGAFDFAVFDEPNGLLKLKPRLIGDANRDGVVDFDDLLALAKNYNKSSKDVFLPGDFNGDGTVNFDDLLLLAKHYNTTDVLNGDVIELPGSGYNPFGQAAAAATVPEPSSAATLAAASAGAALLGRRRRRRTATAAE
jgi:hypothetical protein